MDNKRTVFITYHQISEGQSSTIHLQGVSPELGAKVAGTGTILLATVVNGDEQHFLSEDVFHVPSAKHALLSPSKATEQGFQFEMRPNKEFTLSMAVAWWY